MVVIKKLDTIDNIFIKTQQLLIQSPLDNNNFIFMLFGEYKLANTKADNNFTKLNTTRNQDIDRNRSEDDSGTD